ncbi:MAG: glycoside hydrolase family 31 protein [Kofleriaceae bacterium]
MRAWLAIAFIVGACGNDSEPPPDTLTAGPVTIDTRTLTLTIGDLTIDHFVAVGDVGEPIDIDDARYYDPRGGDAAVELVTLERGVASVGDSVILDGGTKLRLTPCAIDKPGERRARSNAKGDAKSIDTCAELELDASEHPGAVQLQIALPVDPDEPLYGTGDAPLRANVNGTVRELQLRIDPGSESSLNETHVPVPLVLWPRRSIGLFAADDRPAAIDLGKTTAGRVTVTFTLPARGTYKFYLFRGGPLDLLRTYTALSAKPAVPPRWAFAPQQWRNVWNSSDEVRGDADEMRTRKIPGSVMWIDNPWQTAYNTFVVDEARLAGAQQLIADLTARGYKVLFWSTPYVGTTAATAADYAEGKANRFFVTDDSDNVIDYPWQDGPGAMVDFTRPGAAAFWQQRISRITGLGAAGFKLDFGEEIVTDIAGAILPMRLAAGDNASHHRRYQEFYHQAYLEAFPPGEGFLITRAGTWGEQRTNTAIWPGDLASDFSIHGEDNGDGKTNVGGLPSAISRGLSLSVSGYPFYGSDIGGFRGFPTTEALLRWAEYAAFGSIMQLGGGGANHNPWDTALFDPGAAAIYKVYADLHMQLNPYLWMLALQAGADGTPVTRPARFIYDCACDDAMFLLGDDILVAPVVTAGATTRAVVLPPGTWMDRDSGAVVTGDGATSNTVPAPLGVLPRWHRAPSMVPMFARAADTLLPTTVAGITSYSDPAFGRELRVVYTPGEGDAGRELDDGSGFAKSSETELLLRGGREYTVFTFDVDGRGLGAPWNAVTGATAAGTPLASVANVESCAAPGCFHFDPVTKHLEVRVFVAEQDLQVVTVQ